MTIASGGNVTAQENKDSIDPWPSIAIATNNALAGGSAVGVVGADNPSATTGNQDTAFHTAVTDSKGNTWILVRERSSSGNTGGAAVCSVWYCPLIVSSLTTADTLAVDLSAAVAAKAISVWAFTVPLEVVEFVVAHGSSIASQTIEDLPNGEYLAVRGVAQQTNNTSWSPTSGWTALTTVATTGSGAGTNIAVKGEFLIATDTEFTSAPSGGSPDHATVFAVFKEASPPGDVALELVTATEHTIASPLTLHVDTGAIALNLATATEHTTASPLLLNASGSAALHWAEATEDTIALPLGLVAGIPDLIVPVVAAGETTTAQPLTLAGSGSTALQLATAAEHTTAAPLALRPGGILSLETATEETTAAPLSLAGSGAATLALVTAAEDATAAPLTLAAGAATGRTLTLATAIEETTAQPLTLAGSGAAQLVLATATEATTAKALILGFPPALGDVDFDIGDPHVGWRPGSLAV